MNEPRPPVYTRTTQGPYKSVPRSRSLAVAYSILFIALVALTGCTLAPNSGGGSGNIGPANPDPNAFQEYESRCLAATERLDQAKVVFEPEMTMKKDRSSTVTAIITLNTDVPTETLLPNVHASSAPIRVACEVEAELVASPGEFEITPNGFDTRSITHSQDARWEWIVVPKQVGDFSMVLHLRPAVLVHAYAPALERRNLTTVPISSIVHVENKSNMEAFSDWLKSMTGVLTEIGLLIAALSGIWVAVKKFGKQPSEQDPTS